MGTVHNLVLKVMKGAVKAADLPVVVTEHLRDTPQRVKHLIRAERLLVLFSQLSLLGGKLLLKAGIFFFELFRFLVEQLELDLNSC